MIEGAAIGLFAWIVWSANYEKRMVPDSYQYVAMARGQKVPGPFYTRWLLPALIRERGRVWEAQTLIACVVLHAAVAHAFGVKGALLLAPMHLISWNIKAPVQVDFVALALLGVSLTTQNPWALAVLGLFGGAVKQPAPIFMALAAWSPIPLVTGLIGMLPGFLWARKVDPEVDKNPWLQSPFQTTLASKRLVWANPRIMLLPWGLVLPLALTSWDGRLLAALALAYAPLIAASDNARLYLWALPIALGYAVAAPIPEAWWGAIVLANAGLSVYASEVTHYTRGGIQVT
jgi:hypothetical protein